MPRNTYQDFVTHEELTDCRNGAVARMLLNARITGLLRRSGAMNARSGVLKTWEDPRTMTKQLAVSFDSRAWTGV